MTCSECGLGGQTAMVAGAIEYRHYRPADHRFTPVPAPRTEPQAVPPGRSHVTTVTPVARLSRPGLAPTAE